MGLFSRLLLLLVLATSLSKLYAGAEPVRVGVFQNKPVLYMENDQAKGLFVEMLNAIARHEDWQIEYVPCVLKDCLAQLGSGSLHMMPSLGESPERLDSLLFSSEPVWTFWGTIYANTPGISSVLDLQGKTIAVREGNKITRDLKRLTDEFGLDVSFLAFADYESAQQAFSEKTVGLIAVNNTYAFDRLSSVDAYLTPIVFNPFKSYFAVKKDGPYTAMLPVIDDHMVRYKSDLDSLYYRIIENLQAGLAPEHDHKTIMVTVVVLLVAIALLFGFYRYHSLSSFSRRLSDEMIKNQQVSERLKLASEAGEIGIWEYDLQSRVLIWDAMMYRLYGIDAADFSGAYEAWTSALLEDDLQRAEKELTQAIEQLNDFNSSFRIHRADQSICWIRAHGTLIVDEQGRAIKMIGTNQDITLEKLNEEMLQSRVEDSVKQLRQVAEDARLAKEEAFRANQAKSEFLANMSHELRTPMHAISSFSSLALKRLNDPEKLSQFLRNIQTSASRLTGMLNNLLDLSKIEVGKIVADFKDGDLMQVVNDAVIEVSSLAREKHISIQFDSSRQFAAMFDRQLISQVMINLLSNAIKFSPEHSNINVIVQTAHLNRQGTETDSLRVIVMDQGMGIPASELSVIFERFVQSSKTVAGKTGTGLGLAISREIIELHGGYITAESPPQGHDHGAAFIFEIPVLQVPLVRVPVELEQAISAHHEWREMISRFCNGAEVPEDFSVESVGNEHRCVLGQWIDSGQIRFARMDELKSAHQAFHNLAGECIAYREIGDELQTEQHLKKFLAVSDQVISLLRSIQAQHVA